MIIPDLSDDEWAELVERLTLHADNKMRKLYWRGVRDGAVPGGIGADDMAPEAVESLLDGSRNWDQEKNPDLFDFLKGVIDSKVSNLVNKTENKESRHFDTTDPNNEPVFRARKVRSPEAIVSDQEQRQVIRSSVMAELGDDELVESILECYESAIEKPSEIAELAGVTTSDVNNAKKRITRAADKAFGRPRK